MSDELSSDEFLTTDEVCKILRVTKGTVYRKVKMGMLKPADSEQHTRTHLFLRSEIDKYKYKLESSVVVNGYLEDWLRQDTWYKNQLIDRQLFYRFLRAVRYYSGQRYWIEGLRDIILRGVQKYCRSGFNKDYLQEVVDDLMNEAQIIYDYETTFFPDFRRTLDLIEKIERKKESAFEELYRGPLPLPPWSP